MKPQGVSRALGKYRVGWGFGDDDEPNARAPLEAENGLRQAHRLRVLIQDGIAKPEAFRVSAPAI